MYAHNPLVQDDKPVILCGDGAAAQKLQRMVADDSKIHLRSVSDVQSALNTCSSRACRAVIFDFDLAVRHLKPLDVKAWSAQDVPLLVLLPSAEVDDDRYAHLLRCGVSGFLQNDSTPEVITNALEKVTEGELWLSRKFQSGFLKRSLFQLEQQFTPREREILQRIAAGDTNKDIARHLFITRETVRWHLRCVYTKLGVHNRDALVTLLDLAGGAPHGPM
jgi:DNA-binding NarL/FixJ family response regulator